MSKEFLRKGKLIVIEGCDGAGGETQVKLLKEKMPACLFFQYPDYNNEIGKMIHRFLHRELEVDTNTQFLLYATDMVKDTPKVKSALDEGRDVIMDRYFFSTMVYQGLQGFPLEKALKFAEMFGLVKPDLVILLKIRAETSIKRKKMEKKENIDRWEGNVEWQKMVAERYEEMAKNNVFAKRWVVIDGERTIEEVNKEILRAIKSLK